MIGYQGATIGDFYRYFNGSVIWRYTRQPAQRGEVHPYYLHCATSHSHELFDEESDDPEERVQMEDRSDILATSVEHEATPLGQDDTITVMGDDLVRPGEWVIFRVPLGYASNAEGSRLVRISHTSRRGMAKGLRTEYMQTHSTGLYLLGMDSFEGAANIRVALQWFGKVLLMTHNHATAPFLSATMAHRFRREAALTVMGSSAATTKRVAAISGRLAVARAITGTEGWVTHLLYDGNSIGLLTIEDGDRIVFTDTRDKGTLSSLERTYLQRYLLDVFVDRVVV
jgi:hypothetical protein